MLSKRLMQGVLKKQIKQIITICYSQPQVFSNYELKPISGSENVFSGNNQH